MCLSEIFLIAVLVFALLCFKYTGMSRYVFHAVVFSLTLLFLDADVYWDFNFLIHKQEDNWIRFAIIFICSTLIYALPLLKQRVMIIIMSLGALFSLSSCNILAMIISTEFMMVSSYFLLRRSENKTKLAESNYFKCNVLTDISLFLAAVILVINTSTGNFDDIRFFFSLPENHNRFMLLIVLVLITTFSVRIGLFNWCYGNLDLSKLASIVCLLIPVNAIIFNRLMTDVFCYAKVQDFLRIVACCGLCLSIYTPTKLSGLLRNFIGYNAAITMLCCAMQMPRSSLGLSFLCLSEMLTMLGFFILFFSIRKRFNRKLDEIADLISFGCRYRNLALALSCLLLGTIAFPPSLDFIGKVHIISGMIKCNFWIELIILLVSSIFIITKVIQIISEIWNENDTNYFSVVNINLINVVYVVACMNMFMLPFVCGILTGGCNVSMQ